MHNKFTNLDLLEHIRVDRHNNNRRCQQQASDLGIPEKVSPKNITNLYKSSEMEEEDNPVNTIAHHDCTVKINYPSTDIIELLESTLPPIFCRSQVNKLTHGMVNQRTLANRDSLGIGPDGRFTIGRRVWYRKAPFIAYVAKMIKMCDIHIG